MLSSSLDFPSTMRGRSDLTSPALARRVVIVIVCTVLGALARPVAAADGDIVGVGTVASGYRSDIVGAELDPQGHLVASFGDAGTRVLSIGPSSTDTAN